VQRLVVALVSVLRQQTRAPQNPTRSGRPCC